MIRVVGEVDPLGKEGGGACCLPYLYIMGHFQSKSQLSYYYSLSKVCNQR